MANTVKTIFVLMLENRSFDHLLGYLRASKPDVEGLRDDAAWLAKVANPFGGQSHQPHKLTDPYGQSKADPPHSRFAIGKQLHADAAGDFKMDGFVDSYNDNAESRPIDDAANKPLVMGWFSGAEAPVTDFLARNFAICDHWFAPLPTGTQPNRLMAMSGFTNIDDNQVPLSNQELVYDWLTRNGVRWRVYHHGLPFFTMIPERIGLILGDHFRPFSRFYEDVQTETADEFPQVVFIEPTYSDAPHTGPNNDDHPKGGIARGQAFLLEAYRALMRVPDVFDNSVMIITYDENGGFFDHVAPPKIKTAPPPDAHYKNPAGFDSLGARVPAIIVSPFVTPGAVHHGVMDHVSILKFIGETFGPNRSYSALVDGRPVGSVGDVLDTPGAVRQAPVCPSFSTYFQNMPKAYLAAAQDGGRRPGVPSTTTVQKAFQQGLDELRHHPERRGEYNDLISAFPASSM